MSLTDPIAAKRPPPWPHWVRANVAGGFAMLGRARRTNASAPSPWRGRHRLAVGAVVVLIVMAGTMVLLDAWAITGARRLPHGLVAVFDALTDFGKSNWFLWPVGLALVLIALVAAPSLPHMSRLVLAAISVRLSFLFLAIGLPSLFVSIVKRLIGRARPFVGGNADPFLYLPFSWKVEYASLPSGHAHYRLRGRRRGRCAVAADPSGDVGLRAGHRGEPRRAHRAPPERCAGGSPGRRPGRAPGQGVVRGTPAGLRTGP